MAVGAALRNVEPVTSRLDGGPELLAAAREQGLAGNWRGVESQDAATVGVCRRCAGDRVTWEEFVATLEAYKEHFSAKSREDFAYLRCRKSLQGKPIAERAAAVREIVKFLNDWACRVNSTDTPIMLAAWVRENAARLEALVQLTVADDQLPVALSEIGALYDSLLAAGRAAIPNWSDAANSKVLHQLIPGLFVMWDNSIKPFAADYGDFMDEMHHLARRLIRQSPYHLDEAEERLQAHLGYRVRKTMAKYLDEFNWHVMVGAAQVGQPRRG